MEYKIINSEILSARYEDAMEEMCEKLYKENTGRDVTPVQVDLLCLLVLVNYLVQNSLDRDKDRKSVLDDSLCWLQENRSAYSTLDEKDFKSILDILFRNLKEH